MSKFYSIFLTYYNANIAEPRCNSVLKSLTYMGLVQFGSKYSIHFLFSYISFFISPCLGGSVVSVSDSRPGGCEFDPCLRRLFFQVYFRLSPLQKHVRKVVGGFGKKNCVSTGVRKPGNTYASPTAMI